MADNKKYYYLKLKENFFDTDEMIILESMPDGYLYSNILLKLYLRSLKNEGKLMFNDRIPFNAGMLAQVTRHSLGVVEKAMSIFSNLDLVEVLDNGAIYMSDIQNFIGESSTEADRIRVYRKRIEKEKAIENGECTKAITNVRQMSGQTFDKSTPELEIELEIEKEIKTPSAKTSFSPMEYIKKLSFSPPLEAKLLEWISYKKENRKTYKETGLRNLCSQVKKQAQEYGEQVVIDLITECIANSYQGIIWDKLKRGGIGGRSGSIRKTNESDNSKYNGLVL